MTRSRLEPHGGCKPGEEIVIPTARGSQHWGGVVLRHISVL